MPLFKFPDRLTGDLRDFDWMLESGQLLSGVASFEGLAVPFFHSKYTKESERGTGLTGTNGEFDFQGQVEE